MIRLDSTMKLQVFLAGAVATNQLDVVVNYSDLTPTGYGGGGILSVTAGATPVDICSPPAADVNRDIDFISVFNTDTAEAVPTIVIDKAGVDKRLISIALGVSESLEYTHGVGFKVLDSTGAVKQSLSVAHSALTGLDQPDHPAGAIVVTPVGNLAANRAQAAFEELQADIDVLNTEADGAVLKSGIDSTAAGAYTSTLTYNETTRTVTIAPTGTDFDVYVLGVKYTKTAQSLSHAATGTNHFFYFDDTGTLVTSTSPWNILTHAPVAFIFQDVTNGRRICFEERHHSGRDVWWHRNQHTNEGTKVSTTVSASGYTLNDGSLDSAVTYGLATFRLEDEDIRIDTEVFPDAGPYNILKRVGASGAWEISRTSVLPFLYTGNQLQYNLNTAGTWSDASVTEDYYVNYWVFGFTSIPKADYTPAHTSPQQVCIIAAQTQHATAALASAESFTSISWGTIPFQELAPLYQVTMRFNATAPAAYTNTARCAITAFTRIVGTAATLTAAAAVDHGSLTGLSDLDHPASAIINTPAGLITETDVQGALNGLETRKAALSGAAFTGPVTLSGTNALGVGTTTPKTAIDVSGTTTQTLTMPLSTISGFTLTVPNGQTLTGTPVIGDRVWGPNIAAGTRITAIVSAWVAGVTDGVYTVSISQTVAAQAIYGTAEKTNVIRVTDTDTSVLEGQHVGALEFYASDTSAPGAGVRGFIEVVAENTTPDHALVIGILDDDDPLATQAREVARFHSGGQLQLKKNLVASSVTAAQHAATIDIRLATYDSKSFSVAAQELGGTSVLFSPDGLRMFIVGNSGDDINYYTLSTAWDVTTATYNSNKSIATEELTPGSTWFKPDGTKFYVLGISSMTVFQYSLSTAWDISTLTYDSKSIGVGTTINTVAETVTYGIPFTPDGLSFFVCGQTTDHILRYNMGTAWDVSTATLHSVFGISDRETAARSAFFSADGLNFFALGTTGDDITQWRLHTAYDLTSAVYVGEFSVSQGGTEGIPSGMFFSPDCNKFYVIGQTLDMVHQYSLPLRKTEFLGTSSANIIETTNYIKRPVPVTKTADFVVGEAESWLIVNKGSACSVTLPAAASYPGREMTIKTIQAFSVDSASSNVIPLAGGAAGTAILTGTAGKWATLVSNGTSWEIMAAA